MTAGESDLDAAGTAHALATAIGKGDLHGAAVVVLVVVEDQTGAIEHAYGISHGQYTGPKADIAESLLRTAVAVTAEYTSGPRATAGVLRAMAAQLDQDGRL